MKTYTKRGDKGQTDLYSGERVSKTNIRVHTIGHIDELTSNLGMAKNLISDTRMKEDIEVIQTHLIDFMAIVSSFGKSNIDFAKDKIKWLEDKIDLYSKEYTRLNEFVIPGKNKVSAQVDIARAVTRRAERSLLECTNIRDELKIYINRLSDYLYTIARVIDENQSVTSVPAMSASNTVSGKPSNKVALSEAKELINLIQDYAKYKNCKVAVAVTNKDGNPISVDAMDGSLKIAFELAIKKAYTASALQMPTHELASLTEEGAPFSGLENMLDKKIVTVGGGFPLIKNGELFGAIGVSGGTADEDIDIGAYGKYVWEGE